MTGYGVGGWGIGLNSLKFLETDTLLRWILTLLIKWTPPPGVGGVSSPKYGLKGFFGEKYGLKEIELIWPKIGT